MLTGLRCPICGARYSDPGGPLETYHCARCGSRPLIRYSINSAGQGTTVAGGVAGAAFGGMVGGPVGALVGGIIGLFIGGQTRRRQ